MNEQLKTIMEELKYLKIRVVRIGGVTKFQMLNNKGEFVVNLRTCVDNNLDVKSKWFVTTDTMVSRINSDYRYVTNYRLDCQ